MPSRKRTSRRTTIDTNLWWMMMACVLLLLDTRAWDGHRPSPCIVKAQDVHETETVHPDDASSTSLNEKEATNTVTVTVTEDTNDNSDASATTTTEEEATHDDPQLSQLDKERLLESIIADAEALNATTTSTNDPTEHEEETTDDNADNVGNNDDDQPESSSPQEDEEASSDDSSSTQEQEQQQQDESISEVPNADEDSAQNQESTDEQSATETETVSKQQDTTTPTKNTMDDSELDLDEPIYDASKDEPSTTDGQNDITMEEPQQEEQSLSQPQEDVDYPPIHCGVWGSLPFRSPVQLDILFDLFQDIQLGPERIQIPSAEELALHLTDHAFTRAAAAGAAADEDNDELDVLDEATLQEMKQTVKNKSPNSEFVEGLDDLDKFFEDVDPPDELDVGAMGSSIQEVLMSQGSQIVRKRIIMGWQFTKKSVLIAKQKIVERVVDNDGNLSVSLPDKERVLTFLHKGLETSKELYHKVQSFVDNLFEGNIPFFSNNDDDDNLDFGDINVEAAGSEDPEVRELLRQYGISK